MDVTSSFDAEVARLRLAGVPGASGRLRDLFDWLAARGAEAPGATQAQIAAGVFREASADADDATVRVYIHRLRKRIEDFYADHGAGAGGERLEIPSGSYALRLSAGTVAQGPPGAADRHMGKGHLALLLLPLSAMAALLVMFVMMWQARPNAVWLPLADSERPLLLVLGDYYIFGEIDPLRPEEGRLIRDFRVNSAQDLLRMQEAEPLRYQQAEEVGLNYLPFSSAHAIQQVAPILADSGRPVELIAASQLQPDMLNRYDIVYLGLFSGMGLLEELAFRDQGLRLGASYDELHDVPSGRHFTSSEARSLASPAFYRDYALLSRFEAPGGAQVLVLAGTRDTGLRALAPIATAAVLDDRLADAASEPAFEALFETTGRQGADLSERLLLARARE